MMLRRFKSGSPVNVDHSVKTAPSVGDDIAGFAVDMTSQRALIRGS